MVIRRRTFRLRPWVGPEGTVSTVAIGPVTGVMASQAQAASFAGAGTAAQPAITGALASQAQAASFAGAGTTTQAVTGVMASQAQAASFAGAGTAAGGGDVTAPTLSSAVINSAGTSLTLTYNEALDTGSTPATGAYTVGGPFTTDVTAVLVTGSTVVLTLSPAVSDGATMTVSYTPGGSPVQDVAGNDAASLTSQAVTNNSTAVWTPDRIFTGGTSGALRPWYRADDVVIASGKVSQRNDRSGNGLHEVPIGTSPNPARQPTYVASDSRINNQPTITYQGEAEASANRDATGVTMTRATPSVTHRVIFRVFCQEGPNLGVDRACFSDATSQAFTIRRPSGTGSSDATIRMMNASSTTANPVTPVDTQYRRHVASYTNSTLTDYQQWGATVVSGGNAGNSAGTERRTALNSAGTAWSWISVAEEVEVEFPAGSLPTMLQLSRLDAYLANRYGSGILAA